ncbi:hypothetical protein C900_00935 [Fulvivirga imtechensis AK7]|uniref:Uncharacterized protein n=1 Tax=Fulvivirga imtechensis AK7 TaxID=1237149 RepID=L8JKS6_9BACT|nr:hypothetical protein C900_00935 [Fulvivirga imtechensis AK7]
MKPLLHSQHTPHQLSDFRTSWAVGSQLGTRLAQEGVKKSGRFEPTSFFSFNHHLL